MQLNPKRCKANGRNAIHYNVEQRETKQRETNWSNVQQTKQRKLMQYNALQSNE